MQIIFDAPCNLAPMITDKPTPPAPITTTVSPFFTFARFKTAPTPVVTAQPRSAAISKGIDLSTETQHSSGTTTLSDQQPSEPSCLTGPLELLNLHVPSINVPLPTCV